MIELVPASPAHVGVIANRMRLSDVQECAAFGRSPKSALRLGLIGSSCVLTAKLNGRPEAMMGIVVTNALCGACSPWMLGTEAIYDHPRAMIRMWPKVRALWRGDSTTHASNLVSSENTRAIRLLRRWGFEIGKEVTMVGGIPFLTFSMDL